MAPKTFTPHRVLHFFVSLRSAYFFLAFALVAFAPQLKAQTTLVDSAASFPVIMQHYTQADLQAMDSTKLKTVIYYYTQSFTVTAITCSDCIPFDPTTFDITLYESHREFNTVYEREFDKYGFKLTLVPIDQMTYRLPIYDRYYNTPVDPTTNTH